MSNANTTLLTSKEAARFLRISTRTLFNLTRPRGRLLCVRIGRSVRYAPASLQAWVDSQSMSNPNITERK